jgi:PTS system fructose-specific IIA component/PTS system nitrogen regulatory IIA component
MEFLHNLLNEKLIKPDLKSKTKDDVLVELAQILVDNNLVEDKNLLVEKLKEREAIETTGIGHNIAIPHARTETVSGLALAFGISRDGIDFKSFDSKPVHIFFLIASNEENKNKYIQLLARISRICRKESFREKILKAETAKDIIRIFKEEETV